MADEHNRLDSQFSIVGAFWAPEKSDMVRTGTLTADERGITFTTAPEYKRGESAIAPPANFLPSTVQETVPVLHGFTEHGLCTLCDLIENGRPGLMHHELRQSIEATSYRISTIVTGMHMGGSGDNV